MDSNTYHGPYCHSLIRHYLPNDYTRLVSSPGSQVLSVYTREYVASKIGNRAGVEAMVGFSIEYGSTVFIQHNSMVFL